MALNNVDRAPGSPRPDVSSRDAIAILDRALQAPVAPNEAKILTPAIGLPPREVPIEVLNPLLLNRERFLALPDRVLQDQVEYALLMKIHAPKPFSPSERAAHDQAVKAYQAKLKELRPDFEERPLSRHEVLQFELWDRLRDPKTPDRKADIERSISLMDPKLRTSKVELAVALTDQYKANELSEPYGEKRGEIGGYKNARWDKYKALKRAFADLGIAPLYWADRNRYHPTEIYRGESPGSELSPDEIRAITR